MHKKELCGLGDRGEAEKGNWLPKNSPALLRNNLDEILVRTCTTGFLITTTLIDAIEVERTAAAGTTLVFQ